MAAQEKRTIKKNGRRKAGSVLDNLTVCPPPSDVQSGPVGLDLKVWSSYVSVSNLVGTSCRERERERDRDTHTPKREKRWS